MSKFTANKRDKKDNYQQIFGTHCSVKLVCFVRMQKDE